MKIRQLCIIATLLVCTTAAQAATYVQERLRYDTAGPETFRANEFSIDLFGTYARRDLFGAKGDHWGGGLGFNYFPIRYLGLGVDTYIEEWEVPYRANASLILRMPFERYGFAGIAPYGIAGGGRQFRWTPQWTYHAGGGLEFRINPYTGIFGEYRYVWCEDTPDYNFARAGLRLSF